MNSNITVVYSLKTVFKNLGLLGLWTLAIIL